jgi:hypothetical protein
MCLAINKKRTKRVLRTLKEHDDICVMWKILRRSNGELIAPYHYTKYLPGINDSNRHVHLGVSAELTDHEMITGIIYHGIHVFTNNKEALKWKREWLCNQEVYVVVPVRVRKIDFIAAGNDYDAVFNRIHLSEKDYSKALPWNLE